MIGDHEPAGVDDDARAKRLGDAAPRLTAAAKELAEDRIVEQGIVRALLDTRGVNVDDGGRDALHHRGVGKHDLAALARDNPLRLRPAGHGRQRQQHGDIFREAPHGRTP